jgi:hypothetical protein
LTIRLGDTNGQLGPGRHRAPAGLDTLAIPLGRLAVVTETGLTASVTSSAGCIWAELARLYGHSLVLLEHTRRQAHQEEEHLDLVRIGRDGQPHWTRVWPTGEDNPAPCRAAGLDDRLCAPDRQHGGERCRLVPRRGHLSATRKAPSWRQAPAGGGAGVPPRAAPRNSRRGRRRPTGPRPCSAAVRAGDRRGLRCGAAALGRTEINSHVPMSCR